MGAATVTVEHTAPRQITAKPISKARTFFRTLHLVLGLSFGLVLVSQGLSGATLVWRPELDRLMLPKLTHATAPVAGQNALDAGLAAVKAAVPEGRVRMVRLPVLSGGTDEWMVQMPSQNQTGGHAPHWMVYTSPADGHVLGRRGPQKDALQFLIELHHSLLWGNTGRTVLGVLAIATILLALSGLWLWWPEKWTPSRFRPRAIARPLHYALGFWAMWPLLAIATTATYFVWRQPIQQAFGVAGSREQGLGNRKQETARGQGQGPKAQNASDGNPDKGSRETNAAAVSLDTVLAAARAAQPNAKFTTLRFPEGKGGAYTVMFEAADENYRAAPNSIAVRISPDGAAKVDKVTLWRDLPARRRFLEWLPRIHQGEFGGPVIRLIWSLTGMMPAVLYVSGFLMWRRRLAAKV